MAHRQQLDFVATLAKSMPDFFSGKRVLEIGSMDINGSVRRFFKDCDYLGIDVGPGPGVDIVCQGQDFRGGSESFDVVISCEVMEHNPYWVETTENMIRMLRPGGLFVLTCATTGRAEHGTARTDPKWSPNTVSEGWEYYKNLTSKHFSESISLSSWFAKFQFFENWDSFDLYLVGIKNPAAGQIGSLDKWKELQEGVEKLLARDNISRRSRYRKMAARLFGDKWFKFQRSSVKAINYWGE